MSSADLRPRIVAPLVIFGQFILQPQFPCLTAQTLKNHFSVESTLHGRNPANGILGSLFAQPVPVLHAASTFLWQYGRASSSGSGLKDGFATIKKGKCREFKSWDLWNKCSYSILLGGSNYPMQCHSVPTREEINKGNQKRVTFDIGIPSVKNLMRLSRRESIFWGFLAASSVPLHLVYNSAIFFSISSHAYSLLVVTPDFLSGASLRNTTQRVLG